MMKYNAAQKVYFQIQIVQDILEDLEMEVFDLGLSDILDEVKEGVQEISSEAYQRAKDEA